MAIPISEFSALLKKTAQLYADAADLVHIADQVAIHTPDIAENFRQSAAIAYHKAVTSAEKARDYRDALVALAVAKEADAAGIAADTALARSLVGV